VLTWLYVTAGLLVASFVKGTTGLGFPLIATPMVALVVDLRTTYALLVLPNIVMDILQILRREPPWALWRRLLPLFIGNVLGVFLGTQIFLAIAARAVYAVLAGMIGLFLASTWLRLDLSISREQERWLGPLAGFLAGVLNGIANVPGPPLAIYLLGLELPKRDLVKALASTFLVTKIGQMAAISQGGMVTGGILLASSGLTVLALAGFWAGLQAQDRIPQRAFLRCLYVLLACMAGYYAFRAL
jgi:uncharacterized membrane protein YfcA